METIEEEKVLDVRMYFFVPYNISDKQMGIQAGHASLRYARLFSADNPEVWDFVDNHETWIMLNGGTMNAERDFDGKAEGTMNQLADGLLENDIQFSYFLEPDLNGGLSALCFLCSEQVFNFVDYPNFMNYIVDIKMYKHAKDAMPAENLIFLMDMGMEKAQEMFPEYYKEWVRFMGGVKNVFLRSITEGVKKA
jgi:hypothetical protein